MAIALYLIPKEEVKSSNHRQTTQLITHKKFASHQIIGELSSTIFQQQVSDFDRKVVDRTNNLSRSFRSHDALPISRESQ